MLVLYTNIIVIFNQMTSAAHPARQFAQCAMALNAAGGHASALWETMVFGRGLANLTMKHGGLTGFHQQKWWFNRVSPTKVVKHGVFLTMR